MSQETMIVQLRWYFSAGTRGKNFMLSTIAESPRPDSNWGSPGFCRTSYPNEYVLLTLHSFSRRREMSALFLQPGALPLSYEGMSSRLDSISSLIILRFLSYEGIKL